MKEVCNTRVKEAKDTIKKADKGDKDACFPKEGARQLVGCYAAHLRETQDMDFGPSVKEAWRIYKKYKC